MTIYTCYAVQVSLSVQICLLFYCNLYPVTYCQHLPCIAATHCLLLLVWHYLPLLIWSLGLGPYGWQVTLGVNALVSPSWYFWNYLLCRFIIIRNDYSLHLAIFYWQLVVPKHSKTAMFLLYFKQKAHSIRH